MVHDKPGSESEQRATFSAFLTGLKGESWHQLQRKQHRVLNVGLGTVGVRNISNTDTDALRSFVTVRYNNSLK